jgi:hypothetical protein
MLPNQTRRPTNATVVLPGRAARNATHQLPGPRCAWVDRAYSSAGQQVAPLCMRGHPRSLSASLRSTQRGGKLSTPLAMLGKTLSGLNSRPQPSPSAYSLTHSLVIHTHSPTHAQVVNTTSAAMVTSCTTTLLHTPCCSPPHTPTHKRTRTHPHPHTPAGCHDRAKGKGAYAGAGVDVGGWVGRLHSMRWCALNSNSNLGFPA